MSAAIIARGSIASLPATAGAIGACPPCAIARDAELEAGGLDRPFCARAPVSGDDDRAALLLSAAVASCIGELDRVRPSWRSERVGLALATSSGGMASAERLFRARASGAVIDPRTARDATYFGPVRTALARELGDLIFSPCTLVLSACSASTIAIGLGMRWVESDACDLVLAGGFDAVTVFVAAGFEALRATTATVPKPFSSGRDGMALGEGAGMVALAKGSARVYVRGFGASGDAVHLTAPDREGRGLSRAAMRALDSAAMQASQLDLVSAHATATPFNDAAEWRAIHRVLGDRAQDVPVHAFKAQIGHTLGASGAIESLVLADAIERGIVPATPNGDRDPDAPALLLSRAEGRPVRAGLKLSAAFGGANAALVLSSEKGPGARARRPVHASRAVVVREQPPPAELAAMLGIKLERLGRVCDLSMLALAAAAKLARDHDLRGAGLVIGHAYATLDVNESYYAHLSKKGRAEPHRFPYTTPAAAVGEVSLALGLTGPNVAVGSGLHGGLEALCVAADLVASGDCDRVVVLAVDAPGPAAHAVAKAAGWSVPVAGSAALLLASDKLSNRISSWHTTSAPSETRAPGHTALVPLATGKTGTLESSSPQGRAVCEVDADYGTEYA